MGERLRSFQPSTLGLAGAAARSGHAASKGTVVQLTRSLAVELADHRAACLAVG